MQLNRAGRRTGAAVPPARPRHRKRPQATSACRAHRHANRERPNPAARRLQSCEDPGRSRARDTIHPRRNRPACPPARLPRDRTRNRRQIRPRRAWITGTLCLIGRGFRIAQRIRHGPTGSHSADDYINLGIRQHAAGVLRKRRHASPRHPVGGDPANRGIVGNGQINRIAQRIAAPPLPSAPWQPAQFLP